MSKTDSRIEEGMKKMHRQNAREASLEEMRKRAAETAKQMVDCLDSPFLKEEWPEKPTLWIQNAIIDAVMKHDIALTIQHDAFLRRKRLPVPRYEVGARVKFDRSKFGTEWADETVRESVISNIEILIGDPREFGPVSYWLKGVDDEVPENSILEVIKE